MRSKLALIVAATLTASSISAQSKPSLDELLDRLGKYLEEYESQLSSVVAHEVFTQRVYTNRGTRTSSVRVLESDVGFLRLPGGAEWLGFRDVKKIDSRAIQNSTFTMSDVMLAVPDASKARTIAVASARHNLGLPRTINVPTAPLDIIHPRHRGQLRYEIGREVKVGGERTVVVDFVETGRPTFVREPTGLNLVSSGKVWIGPESGAVWRIEWTYQAEMRDSIAPPPPSLRVEFAPHKDLGIMVPTEMIEVFSVTESRGEGRAVYKDFRRFGTSARILPQP